VEQRPKLTERQESIEATLDLLEAIEHGEDHTQRTLASKLGIALGLTNALVKRCVKKGLLKVSEVPAKRFAYYLTPKGFREKSRLTAEYLSMSLGFFRSARADYAEVLAYCESREWKKVVFFGASELTEIASLAVPDVAVEPVAVVQPGSNLEQVGLYTVVQSLDHVGEYDAVVLTEMQTPQEAYDFLLSQVPKGRLLAPSFMRVGKASKDKERGLK